MNTPTKVFMSVRSRFREIKAKDRPAKNLRPRGNIAERASIPGCIAGGSLMPNERPLSPVFHVGRLPCYSSLKVEAK
jgi:hypothetical protein